jgi:hypothetical protein
MHQKQGKAHTSALSYGTDQFFEELSLENFRKVITLA